MTEAANGGELDPRGSPDGATSEGAAPESALRKKRPRRSLLQTLRRLLVLYLLICLGLFALQRKIQYPGDASHAALPDNALRRHVREVEFKTSDGLTLTAWFHAHKTSGTTIILFPGNGGNREWRYGFAQMVRGQGRASVLQVDYRGYGGNPGKPTEERIYLDAEAALAWVRENTDGPIVLMGESLGTGVAIEMASRHPIDGLIIHAGYTSTVDVGASHFWFLPVGLLLRDRFQSGAKIGGIQCPLLFLHGKSDRVIPIRIGEKLFSLANEPKKWIAIEGAGHDDLWLIDVGRYFSAVRDFITDVSEP